MFTFPYGHTERHLSVRAQSSQICCTGTPEDHVKDETTDILFDSSHLYHCSRIHPTKQVWASQMSGEAMGLSALRTQDVLNSELPFPL